GATVLVPLILGFNPNTVIFFSGVATLIFLFVTGFKVPSYLGSSCSFIGSVLAVQGTQNPNHGLAYAGIVMAGVIYLIIGAIVHVVGVNPIRYLLPPVVTGTVVAVIGLALASAATGNYAGEPFTATVTLLAAVGAAVYLRGFPRLLPVLIGIVVGYLVSAVYPPCAAAPSWAMESGPRSADCSAEPVRRRTPRTSASWESPASSRSWSSSSRQCSRSCWASSRSSARSCAASRSACRGASRCTCLA